MKKEMEWMKAMNKKDEFDQHIIELYLGGELTVSLTPIKSPSSIKEKEWEKR